MNLRTLAKRQTSDRQTFAIVLAVDHEGPKFIISRTVTGEGGRTQGSVRMVLSPREAMAVREAFDLAGPELDAWLASHAPGRRP